MGSRSGGSVEITGECFLPGHLNLIFMRTILGGAKNQAFRPAFQKLFVP